MGTPYDDVGNDMVPSFAGFPGVPGMGAAGTIRRSAQMNMPRMPATNQTSRRSQPKTNEAINRTYLTMPTDQREHRSGNWVWVRRHVVKEGDQVYELKDTPACNEMLENEFIIIPAKNGKPEKKVRKYQTKDQFFRDWNGLGMMYRTGVEKHLATGVESDYKVNVVTVHGWVDELENSFGTSVFPGTILAYILKKIKLSSRFSDEVDSNGEFVKRRRHGEKMCWQLEGFGDADKDYPHLRDLEYFEDVGPDKGLRKYGTCIRIAKTNDTPVNTSADSIALAQRNRSLVLPKHEAYIGYA